MNMGKLERITVTMPVEMATKLREAVSEGAYATTSEIIREAVRDWSSERDQREAENAEIREILDRARAGGRRTMEQVEASVLARIEAVEKAQAKHRA